MKKTLLITLLIFTSAICHLPSAIADNSPLGARSAGMGNASVSLADVWSVQNNQAGLGFQKKFSAGIVYQNPFLMKELSTKAFGLAAPVKGGTFGVLVSSFGYSQFSQNKIALAFGKSFGEKISAGIAMDYMSMKFGDAFYGMKNFFVAEMGIQAKPLKNLTLGVHVFNLTKAKLASYNDERIPTIMRIGMDYKFSQKVLLAVEAEKDIDTKQMLKAGIEYRPVNVLYVRAGVATNPSLSCFGFGINLKQFKLDISTTYHSALGFSPHVGLIYEFEKSSKNENDTKITK
ncbi:MAG: hypothetical protein HY063_11125 [Bacteroidetes bacterium]|nr:hypothetical protein [Bacteroidota bacterium]